MTSRIRLLAAVAVGVAVVIATAAAVGVRRAEPTAAATTRAPATARVVRTDLASTTQLTGTLGFGDSTAVQLQGAPGTITALPAAGVVVRAGQRLFEVDGRPVMLMDGMRPAWRDLGAGVAPGPDVRQLERDLVGLGFAGRASLTVDDSYTWATSLAVERWQRATGQAVTGQVSLGRVVFARTPVRIAAAQQQVGAAVQPGQPVLTVTPTTPVVTVDVPVAQAGLVHRGDAVTVTLPSGTPRSGRVSSVSPVVTDGGASSQGGPSTAPNSQGGPQQPQVSAQVVLTGLAGRAGDTARRATVDTAIDQAPVSVTVVDRRVRGVLAVPITALVALAGGGYGVWVDTPGPRHLVPVTPGLFASSLVEVSGSGLAVGDAVEVPSS